MFPGYPSGCDWRECRVPRSYTGRVTDVLMSLVLAAGAAAAMAGLALVARRVRRRGSAGPAIAAAMAAFDEAMHATGYDAFAEMQVQQNRTNAVPAPGDPHREHANRPVRTAEQSIVPAPAAGRA